MSKEFKIVTISPEFSISTIQSFFFAYEHLQEMQKWVDECSNPCVELAYLVKPVITMSDEDGFFCDTDYDVLAKLEKGVITLLPAFEKEYNSK